jgi:hypothetical protein
VSLFGAIFNRALTDDLTTRLGPGVASKVASGGQLAGLSPEKLKAIPPNVVSALLHGIATATSSVFFWAMFVAVLVPVAAVFLKHVPLRGSGPAKSAPTVDEDVAEFDAVALID